MEVLAGKRLKEHNIIRVVDATPEGGTFLEVGIGGAPQLPRLKRAMERGLTYLGLDLQRVADEHIFKIKKAGMGEFIDNGHISYFTNEAGTYNYTLLKLVRQKAKFDLVFLDGHHAFDTDLPAAILCTSVLKDSGFFMLDDVNWSLSKVRRLMAEKPDLKHFYRGLYRFEDYAPEQFDERGIKSIIEDILIPHMGFRPHGLSWPGVAVLERGHHDLNETNYPWQ